MLFLFCGFVSVCVYSLVLLDVAAPCPLARDWGCLVFVRPCFKTSCTYSNFVPSLTADFAVQFVLQKEDNETQQQFQETLDFFKNQTNINSLGLFFNNETLNTVNETSVGKYEVKLVDVTPR